jgi:hypothetical protein
MTTEVNSLRYKVFKALVIQKRKFAHFSGLGTYHILEEEGRERVICRTKTHGRELVWWGSGNAPAMSDPICKACLWAAYLRHRKSAGPSLDGEAILHALGDGDSAIEFSPLLDSLPGSDGQTKK